ncbi:MAG: phosphatase PAP2 family protein [Dehalococcoidia bacterium]
MFRKIQAQRDTAGWLVAVWIGWLVLQAPFTVIRSVGDDLWRTHDVERYERAIFGGVTPGRWLQAHIYSHDVPWFDYTGYVLHGFWFGVPFAFGIVLMIYQRDRLLEFFTWMNVLIYLCAFSFALFPVRPPWMEDGMVRVLQVRHADYISLDNNPMAAFPSLHAALPCAVAIFFFVRCDARLRFYAWLAAVYTVMVSFAIVYMGEHWVLDVAGGYLAAGLTAWLCRGTFWQKVWRTIPGDPVGRLAQLNEKFTLPSPSVEPQPLPQRQPETVPEAA